MGSRLAWKGLCATKRRQSSEDEEPEREAERGPDVGDVNVDTRADESDSDYEPSDEGDGKDDDDDFDFYDDVDDVEAPGKNDEVAGAAGNAISNTHADGDDDDSGDGGGDEGQDNGDDGNDNDNDNDNDDEEVELELEGEEAGGDDDEKGSEPPADYMDDGTEEYESAESEAEIRRPMSIQDFLAWRLLSRFHERGQEATRTRYVPYEEALPQALIRGPLWQQLILATGATGPAVRNRAARFDSLMDAGYDCSMFSSLDAPYGKKRRQALREAAAQDRGVAARVTIGGAFRPPTSASDTGESAGADAGAGSGGGGGGEGGGGEGKGGAAATAAPAVPSVVSDRAAAPAGPRSALPPPGYLSGTALIPAPRMLLRREQGEAAGLGAGWSGAQMRHMQCYRALPRYPHEVVDRLDSRAYIGQFSADGQFFVAAFKDSRVRLYDVERGWRLRKDITTRLCRWTITDTSVSPDQRFVLYSSIVPIVHLVEVGSMYDNVTSIFNVTQVHEPLDFSSNNEAQGFGIWSVQWSGDGREIVVGNNDESVVVMDVETKRVVASARGHQDDVNAVTYADSTPNIIISGSDDNYIKVWDRRIMSVSEQADSSGWRPRPVGVLVGHTEGLTHLHSRGDGFYVLSNAKDQTAKLWDLRTLQAGGSLRDPTAAEHLPMSHVPRFNWDYRWQEYPAAGRVVRHPHDSSVQTFRGHSVQNTLIRAYFSPAHSTGQRFVYTGSALGAVHVYDICTGQEVESSPLKLHRKLVRDVSWHPFDPVLATVSWDGTIVRWNAAQPSSDNNSVVVPLQDAYNYDY
ncbi:hypothetical protein Vafri_2645 [Volvox africanus]|uniref:Uncharacterized protein n=1 Tax=Volvox africanus TaxID=51714 RepID=A0A8J4AQM2_9CHLO|nr:hypothetical protein Vafri_2645 [Volvox africanus]